MDKVCWRRWNVSIPRLPGQTTRLTLAPAPRLPPTIYLYLYKYIYLIFTDRLTN